jgi:hypothetical protein
VRNVSNLKELSHDFDEFDDLPEEMLEHAEEVQLAKSKNVFVSGWGTWTECTTELVVTAVTSVEEFVGSETNSVSAQSD